MFTNNVNHDLRPIIRQDKILSDRCPTFVIILCKFIIIYREADEFVCRFFTANRRNQTLQMTSFVLMSVYIACGGEREW